MPTPLLAWWWRILLAKSIDYLTIVENGCWSIIGRLGVLLVWMKCLILWPYMSNVNPKIWWCWALLWIIKMSARCDILWMICWFHIRLFWARLKSSPSLALHRCYPPAWFTTLKVSWWKSNEVAFPNKRLSRWSRLVPMRRCQWRHQANKKACIGRLFLNAR